MVWIIAFVAAVLLVLAFVLVSAPKWRRWGATDAEVQAHYVADDLVPDAILKSTRAITIDAPVDRVWPWIAQIGRGAGWYAVDFLDNRGFQSADYLMDLPPPAIGDKTAVGSLTSFKPGEHMAFFDPKATAMFSFWRFGIGHVLRSVGADQTRLLLTCRAASTGAGWLLMNFEAMVNDVMETIMGVTQLKTLKRLIESYPARMQTGAINKNRNGGKHQKYVSTYAGQSTGP